MRGEPIPSPSRLDGRGFRNIVNLGAILLAAVAAVVLVQTKAAEREVCIATTYHFSPGCFGFAGDMTQPSMPPPAEIAGDLQLHDDHRGGIVIAADNITLDCDGHQIIGSEGTGIEITHRTGVTVKDCFVAGFDVGVGIRSAEKSMISGVTSAYNGVGLRVATSNNNDFVDNRADFNERGFVMTYSDSNSLQGNKTRRGYTGISISDSTGNRLLDNEVSDPRSAGISLTDADAHHVESNFVRGPLHVGIVVRGSANEIRGNSVSAADAGMTIGGSENTIAGNEVNDTTFAFRLQNATDSTFRDNRINHASRGFELGPWSVGNEFVNNAADAASGVGVIGALSMLGNRWGDNAGLVPTPFAITEDLTLSADLQGPIVIDADGITLDCAGHEIAPHLSGTWAAGASVGIHISGHHNVIVENCELAGYANGVGLWQATGVTIRNNHTSVRAFRSDDNSIVDNKHDASPDMDRWSTAFLLVEQSDRNIVAGNTVTAGGIQIEEADFTTITRNEITGGSIDVNRSKDNTITNNVTERGIKLIESNDNTITHNVATEARIRLQRAHGNTISHNAVVSIYLGSSRGNLVAQNTVTGSPDLPRNRGAIGLVEADENTIADNTVSARGISGVKSRRNTIEGNTLRGGSLALRNGSNANMITDNDVSGIEVGFYLDQSHRNTLRANSAADNVIGFQIRRSHGNTFEGNDASDNDTAVRIRDHARTYNNTFVGNVGM